MTKKTITKEVEAVICDFCNEEIDTKSDDYCYSHISASPTNVYVRQKYNVKHILFSSYRKQTEYVQYDFHASCFDKLMVKFLAERQS